MATEQPAAPAPGGEKVEIDEITRGLGYPPNSAQHNLHQKHVTVELNHLMSYIDLQNTDVDGLFNWVNLNLMNLAYHFPNEQILHFCHSALLDFVAGEPVKVKSAAAICSLFQNGLITAAEKDALILHFLERSLREPHNAAALAQPTVQDAKTKRTLKKKKADGTEVEGDNAATDGGDETMGGAGEADRPEGLGISLTEQMKRILRYAEARGAPMHASPEEENLQGGPAYVPEGRGMPAGSPSMANAHAHNVSASKPTTRAKGAKKATRHPPGSPSAHHHHEHIHRGPSGSPVAHIHLTGVLRDAFNVSIGETGRAALKTMLSHRCKTDPICKEKVMQIGQIKYAKLQELLQMAQACGLEREIQSLQRQHNDRTAHRQRYRKRPRPGAGPGDMGVDDDGDYDDDGEWGSHFGDDASDGGQGLSQAQAAHHAYHTAMAESHRERELAEAADHPDPTSEDLDEEPRAANSLPESPVQENASASASASASAAAAVEKAGGASAASAAAEGAVQMQAQPTTENEDVGDAAGSRTSVQPSSGAAASGNVDASPREGLNPGSPSYPMMGIGASGSGAGAEAGSVDKPIDPNAPLM
uniref:Uncharacterized protein n=1 Tax=Chromera velia CCMP2878 TaxID=1169474 RepID=A0A0G4F890_9ALVE|eukprot:Cvel_2949.t1-p1 / transcript=Cvel_2949.t1 / gene=Cvel_2949 / organism=Chromera_velia_CCMP2878 / gene_product=hypothetical protein / transcript_product=hypothetical protein / location=Cvel_scaffold116:108105-110382(-) / protein_length=588 / sequence_SO=supercontig / SO=protein_coding / is_pseudo=false